MKLLKIVCVFVAVMLLAACAGCAGGTAGQKKGAVELVDMTGRTVTVAGQVERVVALTPADCEILYALGAGGTLVGRGEYCDYPAEALDIPPVQAGYEANVEQIIALRPQLVLAEAFGYTDEQIAQLEQAGIAVVLSDAQDIAGVYAAIGMIGEAVGRQEQAQALAQDMKAELDEVAALAGKESGKTVYFEVSPLEYGLWAAGGGSFMDEIAAMLGLTNCFSDVPEWGEISQEQVIERDPDYIVTITMYYGEGPTPIEEIMSRPGWENVTAVKNGDILNLQNNELSRPAPRLAEGARLLYEFVYEEAAENAA